MCNLEEKLKVYEESSLTSTESMTDLKCEVAWFKDLETYSADIEVQLVQSDESVINLQQTVERLEKDVEQ